MAKKVADLPKTLYIPYSIHGLDEGIYYTSLEDIADSYDDGNVGFAVYTLKETGVVNLDPTYTPDK